MANSSSKSLIIVAHNIRSVHNVGALLRTADGLGIAQVYLTGYTPYPLMSPDSRLPHLAAKINKQINKTALGAEQTDMWQYNEDVAVVIKRLAHDGYVIAGLEQSENSQSLTSYKIPEKLVVILGSEVSGIDPMVLEKLDIVLEIPMLGTKESFNVVEAATMAMYHFRYFATTI